MSTWNRIRLSIKIVPNAKEEKGIEFRFEYDTRLMSSLERYPFSCFLG